jgi:SAM-dependent methyltransferase
MPDANTVARIYGPSYAQDVAGSDSPDPKNPQALTNYLRTRSAGIFVDYGCGDGKLLVAAREMGWRTMGVELSSDVARITQQRTGIAVCTPNAPELTGMADVLHMGDVIEHLTDFDQQLANVRRILKLRGVFVAQGPLENNCNVFHAAVRVVRRFRKRVTKMAPYHTILATSKGQRALFNRMGLNEILYTVTEVTWPAPAQFFSGTRGMILYLLRRISQAVSTAYGGELGNRYFYVGNLCGEGAAPNDGSNA